MIGQFSVFDVLEENAKKIKVFEAFSGYGSQTLALQLYGIPFEHVGIAEIDKYAIEAHEALHGPVRNYGDVSKIDVNTLPGMDLLTYSFPCQDISNAGKQLGLEEGSGTRSSLLWECKKIIVAKKPKFLMMENVKNLISKSDKKRPKYEHQLYGKTYPNSSNFYHFNKWLDFLTECGYNNYYKVVNAKWCGIPQNRERVFCVSILKEYDDGSFKFEEEFDNGLRLKDMLDNQVDEKYYLSDEYLERFLKSEPISETDINIIGTTVGEGKGTNCRHWVHDINYRIGALSATDYKQPKQIVVKANTKKGYVVANEGDSLNLEHPTSTTRRGRVGRGVAQTLTTSCNQAVIEKVRIRKLTPSECLRLMGLTDKQIAKIQATGISNTQQYKMAGNSIVVQSMKFLKNLGGMI